METSCQAPEIIECSLNDDHVNIMVVKNSLDMRLQPSEIADLKYQQNLIMRLQFVIQCIRPEINLKKKSYY